MTKSAPGKGRFERQAVADDGIRKQDVVVFDQYLRERAQALLEEIDNWLTNLPKPDPANGDEVVRTGVGVYHYLASEREEQSFKSLLEDEGLIRTRNADLISELKKDD
jgi:hypothetical protein